MGGVLVMMVRSSADGLPTLGVKEEPSARIDPVSTGEGGSWGFRECDAESFIKISVEDIDDAECPRFKGSQARHLTHP
jgi:hypothetical protein